jgi:hypothetical protein
MVLITVDAFWNLSGIGEQELCSTLIQGFQLIETCVFPGHSGHTWTPGREREREREQEWSCRKVWKLKSGLQAAYIPLSSLLSRSCKRCEDVCPLTGSPHLQKQLYLLFADHFRNRILWCLSVWSPVSAWLSVLSSYSLMVC